MLFNFDILDMNRMTKQCLFSFSLSLWTASSEVYAVVEILLKKFVFAYSCAKCNKIYRKTIETGQD